MAAVAVVYVHVCCAAGAGGARARAAHSWDCLYLGRAAHPGALFAYASAWLTVSARIVVAQIGEAALTILEEDNRKMENINVKLDEIQSDLQIANKVRRAM